MSWSTILMQAVLIGAPAVLAYLYIKSVRSRPNQQYTPMRKPDSVAPASEDNSAKDK